LHFDGSGLLTVTVFLPLVGALLVALVIRGDQSVRYFAGAVALAELALSVVVFVRFDVDTPGVQLVDRVEGWIPFGTSEVQYFLGVDGLSAPLVLLTGLLGMAAVFASWGIKSRVREYFMWLLVLQTAVMGVFTALDFILFFLLWEMEMVPMYFLISIWGSGRKEYSAMKFLIFTFLGSAFMLVGILALSFSTGTFDMTKLPDAIQGANLLIPGGLIFALLFIAFAVKLPVWPVHTWLPDAHTDAPTAVSVMLAGVLLKMGGYGMIRVSAGMFPEVVVGAAWAIAGLGVVNVLYGAMVTLRQTDLKRLVAFSSISHMGFVLIGVSSVAGAAGAVSPVGLTGASMQMFTHGTITGLLFLVVGLLYDKAHTRYIPDLGGLATRMPVIATLFLLAGLASLGLPGTSGFVSEILIFLGTFPVWSWATALAAFGIVLTAGYILWMIQRTLFGPAIDRFESVRDASAMEMVPLFVLAAAVLLVGVYPAVISDVFAQGIEPIIEAVRPFLEGAVGPAELALR
jgi:NADH-quinone oxidoreductase subunit M